MPPALQTLKAWRRLALAVFRSWQYTAGPADRPGQVVKPVFLGRTPVYLVVQGAPRAACVLVNLHENQRTSVESALEVLPEARGRLIRLRAQGCRHVVFWIGWRPHAFDPGRIFSDAGMAATLHRHASDTPAARRALAGLREALLQEIAAARPEVVFALHNNGFGSYDIGCYRPGAALAQDADSVHVDPAADGSDFFLVTSRTMYESLAGRGFGVVLLDDRRRDDGSLAHAFRAADGPACVTIEARHGHRDEQCRMLRLAAAGVPQRRSA